MKIRQTLERLDRLRDFLHNRIDMALEWERLVQKIPLDKEHQEKFSIIHKHLGVMKYWVESDILIEKIKHFFSEYEKMKIVEESIWSDIHN